MIQITFREYQEPPYTKQ